MTILFSNSSFRAQNNIVKKREDGAYLCLLGALNAFNIHGVFYAMSENIKKLLTQEDYNSLGYKLKRGLLTGEGNHPTKLPGETDASFIGRNLIVDPLRTSHSILEIMLEETNESELSGTKVIKIWAWIKPETNDAGNALKGRLEDPSKNVSFSIRCFSKTENINGTLIRVINRIVTWDWVDNPGIAHSSKVGDSKGSLYAVKEAKLSTEASVVITEELLEDITSSGVVVTESAIEDINSLSKLLKKEDSVYKRW